MAQTVKLAGRLQTCYVAVVCGSEAGCSAFPCKPASSSCSASATDRVLDTGVSAISSLRMLLKSLRASLCIQALHTKTSLVCSACHGMAAWSVRSATKL